MRHLTCLCVCIAMLILTFLFLGPLLLLMPAGVHPSLEQAYWVSQIFLVIIALAAACLAWRQIAAHKLQISTNRLFEIVRYLEDQSFYDARRVVVREIGPKKNTEWWSKAEKEHEKFEKMASICAGRYEVVSHLLKFSGDKTLIEFFLISWAESIVRIYGILFNFMDGRRKANGFQYRDFEWLYHRAIKFQPTVGEPWPPIENKNES
jgi:hypothetical protein